MQGNLLQTFNKRQNSEHFPPTSQPTYKFTTEVVSRKNRYRVELLISHKTEADRGLEWKLFGRLTTEADFTGTKQDLFVQREKDLERLRLEIVKH